MRLEQFEKEPRVLSGTRCTRVFSFVGDALRQSIACTVGRRQARTSDRKKHEGEEETSRTEGEDNKLTLT
jgi:hypothetical protein